jgi:hypothetical protein
MAAGAGASMVADLVEDSTEAAVSTAVASGDIAEVGVDLAGVVAGVVMAGVAAGVDTAGAEAGVTLAGDAAGVGVIPVGVGESVSALVGAGVPIGEVTRMRMAIPTIRITHTMTRTPMRRRTRIGITVPTEIRMTARGRIRAITLLRVIPRRRDRVA